MGAVQCLLFVKCFDSFFFDFCISKQQSRIQRIRRLSRGQREDKAQKMSGIKLVVCLAFVSLMTIPLSKAICPGPSKTGFKTFKGLFSIDGCNLCKCKNGHVSCTKKFCGNKCHIDYYMDPCNFCKCIDGMGACTRMYCDLSWSSKQTKETKENKLGMYNGRVRINGKNPDFPYEENLMVGAPNVY